MKIIGTDYNSLFAATKAAYERISGNEVKRDSLIRQFLNLQFFPNQHVGENEHRVPELFEDKAEEKPTRANAVIIDYYDHDERGNQTLDYSNSYICITTEATNRKLRELFVNYYPEHADGEKISEASMVENKIESLAWEEAENDEDSFDTIKQRIEDEVREMSVNDASDWLLEHFDIDDLTDDSFFGDFLHCDLHKIRCESCEVFY